MHRSCRTSAKLYGEHAAQQDAVALPSIATPWTRGCDICGVKSGRGRHWTLLIGRVSDGKGRIRATIVNYACHPVSLGGGNKLLSPDYIGAMREIVERDTDGAMCVFMHGASGDLTPRRSYEAKTEVADQNGRELGYAALSVLSGMLSPGQQLQYRGVEESGTPLGIWRLTPRTDVSTQLSGRFLTTQFPLLPLPLARSWKRNWPPPRNAMPSSGWSGAWPAGPRSAMGLTAIFISPYGGSGKLFFGLHAGGMLTASSRSTCGASFRIPQWRSSICRMAPATTYSALNPKASGVMCIRRAHRFLQTGGLGARHADGARDEPGNAVIARPAASTFNAACNSAAPRAANGRAIIAGARLERSHDDGSKKSAPGCRWY